jgi:MYXO-CTERM domain-containing protein
MKAVKLIVGILVIVPLLTIPTPVSAYSSEMHMMIANQIRDNLLKNWEETGEPMIQLVGPDWQEPVYVLIPLEYAEAIRDYPLYWRGGSVGPDNTVFPGLTDPSHNWLYSPFSQCQSQLELSADPSELAYALGCFAHGIGDNAVHQVVNYFTGQTFTFYPLSEAENGELKFSIRNMVKHMTVEGRIGDAAKNTWPEAFAPEKMEHLVALELYRRVYLENDDGSRGLWHWLAGQLVAEKNEALMAAQLEGFDPDDDLELTIEEIHESGKTVDLDRQVIDAYIDFLANGAEIDGYRVGGLAPHDYMLLLPEIVTDIRKFFALAEKNGSEKMNEIISEWQERGECSILCPILNLKRKLYVHLFDAEDGGGTSRFQQVVELKNQELDQIVIAYVGTVENISRLMVEKGISGMGLTDIEGGLSPLTDAIAQVTAFPYDILFPSWAVDVIDNVKALQSLLQGIQDMLMAEIKAQIIDRVKTFLDMYAEAMRQIKEEAIAMIEAQFAEFFEELRSKYDEAKLALIGIDLTNLKDLIDDYASSVLWMNSYNSVVGVLANPQVVFKPDASSFFSSPVTFDASFQLAYNQMSLCEDLREVFYPCGISAAEMLQPFYSTCQKLDEAIPPDPAIECHAGYATEFSQYPDTEACSRTAFEELIDFSQGHIGSPSLAFPPEYADVPPECFNPEIGGVNSDGKEDNPGNSDPENAGCSCASGQQTNLTWFVFGLIALAIIRTIRRRAVLKNLRGTRRFSG